MIGPLLLALVVLGGQSQEARAPTVAPTGDAGVPFFRPGAVRERPPEECLPASAVNGTQVVLLGAYEGGTRTSFAFEGDGQAVGAVAVGADRTGPPLVAVLSAYDPTVWDLRGVPGARLRGVIVRGYSAQAVAGVGRDIPVRFVTRRLASIGCGQASVAYQAGPALDRLRADVERILRRPVAASRVGYDPTYMNLDHDEAGTSPGGLPTLGDLRSSAPVSRTAVPPMEEGMAKLVASGAIRPASASDVAALRPVVGSASPAAKLPFATMGGLRGAYVVLRAIVVPRGMYGAHSATFLIAPGVPQPVDPGSHNVYVQLDSGACSGAPCRTLDVPPIVRLPVAN